MIGEGSEGRSREDPAAAATPRAPCWAYRRRVRVLGRVVAIALLGLAAFLAVTAALRPYADQQRNVLVFGALLSGAVGLGVLVVAWAAPDEPDR